MAAHTSAGKTVVAEYGIAMAFQREFPTAAAAAGSAAGPFATGESNLLFVAVS